MGLLQAARVEGALDGVSLEINKTDGDCVGLESIQGCLIAKVFEVVENIGTGIAIRVVRERAHATARVVRERAHATAAFFAR